VSTIDHLVYVTPDVEATAADLGNRLGVEPVVGGRHVGKGTWNQLLSLDGGVYLEIIGPDREAPEPEGPRPFGVDDVTHPTLLTWSAAVSDIPAVAERARMHAYDPGPCVPMQRVSPSGVLLSWMLTMPPGDASLGGVVPFLIDWLDTPLTSHPAATSPAGCTLQSFWVEHPQPDRIKTIFAALDCTVEIRKGDTARVAAGVRSTSGAVIWL
jgi:hypothetical protein